jgi:hypothetical protein
MILLLHTGIELWRTGSVLYGQMRLKSTAWGQMEGSRCGSGREKDSQIGQCRGRSVVFVTWPVFCMCYGSPVGLWHICAWHGNVG